MADATEVIASPKEETIPEPEPESPSTKRQQPSPSPPPLKRQRTSTSSAESPATLRESPKADKHDFPKAQTRKTSIQEERKRGQRLFGGLLSTLSQSSTGTQQKRRQDIEKRQVERAKRQKIEDEGRRLEKLQILKELRTQDMVNFDEESMRLRHSNMLAMAQFLQTKAEPKLYYKPWELRPEDSECIKRQVSEAEEIIAREVDEFYARNPSKQPKPQDDAKKEDLASKGEKDASPLPDSTVADSSTNDAPGAQKDTNEGEVVLEAAEDTVIY